MTACLRVFATLLVFTLALPGLAAADEMVPIGVGRVDITPDGPIRLTGYASRKTESEGVALRLWAKALAIGSDGGDGPAVLMMVENCGVPASLTAEVAGRLKAKARIAPQRIVICSTHTHAGPWLTGFATALSSEALPPEHRAHMEQCERRLVDKMEQAALAMVFLPGEVVVDYALRLKRELDGARLWVTAYANDVPCYIVSRRVLAEGGYEPDYSMIYYGRPTRLSPAVEDKIVEAAKSLLPGSFVAGRK